MRTRIPCFAGIDVDRNYACLQDFLWPGRDRTCDLGIKSPVERAAARYGKAKRAASGANRYCNELRQSAMGGDQPVRASVHTAAVCSDNSVLPERCERPTKPVRVKSGPAQRASLIIGSSAR
jgi:hypothetical protein